MLVLVAPSSAEQSGVGRQQRVAVDHLADREVHVMRLDELSAHRPLRGGGPLCAGGRGGPVQRVKIGYEDAVEKSRHAASAYDLQSGRSVPIRGEALHGTRGEIK